MKYSSIIGGIGMKHDTIMYQIMVYDLQFYGGCFPAKLDEKPLTEEIQQ